jgi:hypothetical protein
MRIANPALDFWRAQLQLGRERVIARVCRPNWSWALHRRSAGKRRPYSWFFRATQNVQLSEKFRTLGVSLASSLRVALSR